MADNVVNTKVLIDDKGTLKALIKQAGQLRKELEASHKAMGGSFTPTPVKAARAAAGAEAGYQSGLARSVGTGAGTGASARDFAKQAEGLGGLVRLYATFAANIFAVSTAFTALSRAADTENMIKGLDQLGAATGRNLGALSKLLVQTTDGAVSLREAVTAVAQASSGGLSNSNILKLGEVAQKASQALGIDMTNALSRLSRGITKLEPELLDEIGIFVRVDKAAQDYARSVGKTVSSLTDFERRQAFANAVLEQGAEKFGKIELAANPYSKILANLQNLATGALTVINTALSPLLNILSSSPTALGLTVAALAGVLLKQAVPAIGRYRENLAMASKEASKFAAVQNSLRKQKASSIGIEEANALADQLASVKKEAKEAADSLTAQYTAKNSAIRKSTRDLFASDQDVLNMSNQQIAALEKRAASIRKGIEAGSASMSERVIKARRLEAASIERVVRLSKEYGQLNEKNNAYINESVGFLQKRLSLDAAFERNATRAANRAQRLNILDDVSQELGSRGVRASITELNRRITEAKNGQDEFTKSLGVGARTMSGYNAAVTKAIGVAQILGTAIGTVVGSFLHLAGVVGALIAVGAGLLSFMTTSSKESDRVATSLDVLDSTFDNIAKTIDTISKKKDGEFLSVESIQARATAMQGLSDAVTDFSLRIDQKLAKDNWAAKVIDFFKGFADKDLGQQLEDTIYQQITSALDLLEDPALRAEASKSFSRMFNVDVTDVKKFKAALDDLSTEELAGKLREVDAATKSLALGLNNNASILSSFKTGMSETTKVVNDLYTSLKANDIQSKLGQELTSRALELSKATGNIAEDIQLLDTLAGNTKVLALLPEDMATDLAKASTGIREITEGFNKSRKAAAEAEKAYAKALKEFEKDKEYADKNKLKNTTNLQTSRIELERASAERERASREMQAYEAKARGETARLAKYTDQLFKSGIERMALGLKEALVEAGSMAARSYLDVLKQAGGNTAELEYNLKMQEIAQQKSLIEVQYAVIKQEARLELAIRESNALANIERINTNKLLSDADKAKDTKPFVEELKILSTLKPVLESKIDTKNLSSDTMKTLAKEFRPLLEAMFGRDGQLAKIAAQGFAAGIARDVSRVGEARTAAKAANDASTSSNTRGLNTLESISTSYDAIQQQKKIALELSNAEIAAAEALFEITAKQATILIAMDAANKQGNKQAVAEAQKALAVSEVERQEVIKRNEQNILNIKLKGIKEEFAGKKELMAIDEDRVSVLGSKQGELSNQQIELAKAELEFRKEQNRITESDYSSAIRSLDLKQAAVSSAEKLLDLENKRAEVELLYQERVASANAIGGADGAALLAKANAERERSLSFINAQIAAENNLATATAAGISAIDQRNQKLAIMNEQMERQTELITAVSSAAQLLGEAFGKAGEAVGGVATALTANFQKQEAINKKLTSDREKFAKDKTKLAKAEEKAEIDSRDAQLETYGMIANSVKKLFKEKTVAYKAFSAVEKAIHVMRIANNAKEIISGMQATIAHVTQSGTRSVAKGIEAVISSLTLPPPLGWVAAGITAAMVASLLGKSVGGSVSMPSGFDAESQQKVQGTGQAYVNGELVNRGGGALGDPTAKAESLNTAMEKIEEHTFEFLEYSNDMLTALRGIQKNTENLGAILLQAGLNLKNVNPDGTQMELGTTLAKVPKMIGMMTLGAAIFGENSGLGKLNQKMFNSVFGGKVTKELLDNGIQAIGQLGQLMTGGGNISEYINIKTTKDGGWFRSDKTSFDTETEALTGIGRETVSAVFAGIAQSVSSAAELLGKDKSTIDALVNSFESTFKVSLKDLSPEEVVEALTNEFSVQFNLLSERVLPEFQRFRKAGEEFGDTIVRIASNAQDVSFALEASGMALGDLSRAVITTTETITDSIIKAEKTLTTTESVGEATVRITQALIDKFGDLESFIDKSGFFTDNFLTDGEKLLPVQKRLNAELERLQNVALDAGLNVGIAGVSTREGFANAVQSLDLTTEAGQVLYSGLLNVAGAFAEVYGETRNTADSLSTLREQATTLMEEISDSLFDDDLPGQIARITAERAREKQGISEASSAMFDLVTNLQILQVSLADAKSQAASAAATLRNAFSQAKSEVSSAQAAVKQDFESAKSRLEQAQKNAASAASAASEEAANQAAQLAASAQEARNAMIDLSTALKDFVKETLTSELGISTAEEKLKILRAEYNNTLTAAKAGDKNALAKLPEVSRNLLTAAKDQASDRTEYLKTFGTVTNDLSAISNAIDAVNGTTKVDTGGWGGSSGSGYNNYANAMAELAEAQKEFEKALRDAKEAKVDIKAGEKTSIEKWREAVNKLTGIQGTLDELGIEYKDLLLEPEDAYLEAIATYRAATLAVAAFSGALAGYSQQLSSYVSQAGSQVDPRFVVGGTPTTPVDNTPAGVNTPVYINTSPVYEPAPSAVTPPPPSTAETVNPYNTITVGEGEGAYSITVPNPNYIPGYASGTSHFGGGLRVVGEQGMEMEATGPSKIWSAEQTKRFFQGPTESANNALISEIRQLRNEVNKLYEVGKVSAVSAEKTSKILNRVTRGGDSMVTEAA